MPIYAVEYSVKENSYHVHTVEEMVALNLEMAEQRISKDYLPIKIAISMPDALKFIEWHRKTMQKFRSFKKYIEPSKKFVYVQMPGSEN